MCDYIGFEMYRFCVFFFQAEDGIRDLVRSRGLGDVYKRQGSCADVVLKVYSKIGFDFDPRFVLIIKTPFDALEPVSYTHLTLPTSDLV